jgi:hypothetical protein
MSWWMYVLLALAWFAGLVLAFLLMVVSLLGLMGAKFKWR